MGRDPLVGKHCYIVYNRPVVGKTTLLRKRSQQSIVVT